MKVYSWRFHIAYGLHSNIPICCCIWFTFIFRFLSRKYRNLYFIYTKGYGYMPCPICKLLKRKRKIDNCTEHSSPCKFRKLIIEDRRRKGLKIWF